MVRRPCVSLVINKQLRSDTNGSVSERPASFTQPQLDNQDLSADRALQALNLRKSIRFRKARSMLKAVHPPTLGADRTLAYASCIEHCISCCLLPALPSAKLKAAEQRDHEQKSCTGKRRSIGCQHPQGLAPPNTGAFRWLPKVSFDPAEDIQPHIRLR